MHQELIEEFRGKILPPNHPLTRQIRKIVERILAANDLGHLKGSEPSATFPQLLSQVLPGFDTHNEGGWDPDMHRRPDTIAPGTGGGGREWNLLVVNDPNVVNAMATYGKRFFFVR
jgi:metalloendopeptidase OMA1, mitochondrial